jgi:3-deoxy-D-manno-octulosonate 8-phosphate phosphatase (KDO 8-P phosphatase)
MVHDARRLFAPVELVLLDVDGVLTDGGLYYLDDGGFAVRFHVRDGFALARARREGLTLGLISGRPTPQVRHRAEELSIEEVHLDVRDKGSVVEGILERRGVPPQRACFVGDDLIDIPAMHRVGVPVAVADAMAEVRDAAAYVTRQPGGHGAVREIIDLILAARAPSIPRGE